MSVFVLVSVNSSECRLHVDIHYCALTTFYVYLCQVIFQKVIKSHSKAIDSIYGKAQASCDYERALYSMCNDQFSCEVRWQKIAITTATRIRVRASSYIHAHGVTAVSSWTLCC